VTTHLQALIADYLRNHPGETYASIARRGGMKPGTVQAIATRNPDGRQTPRPATITGLARGMEIPEAQIREAVAHGAGYGTPGAEERPEVRLLLATIEGFDSEQLESVLRRARHLRAEMDEEQARKHK
jgi:hypothetical protein